MKLLELRISAETVKECLDKLEKKELLYRVCGRKHGPRHINE